MSNKILVCFGTRPEYIKVKSLIDHLPNTVVLFTGQHPDLIKEKNFDHTFIIENKNNNRLNGITEYVMKQNNIFEGIDYILVQGDTTSAMSIALSAYHNNIKVIHLEAGLRTNNINDPFPEEVNRQLISRISSINLCPTESNKKNLLKENVSGAIYVTGNTGLDNITKDNCKYGNKVLITMHRRDNHSIMDKWFKELSKVSTKYSDLKFIIPIHPNPNVQKHKHLLKNIDVIDPINHNELIDILKECRFVISDSGGLQEESSFLNKKIIICRRTTERPEIIGGNGIMCYWPEDLVNIVDKVYNDYNIDLPCPFGDGKAWKKIVSIINKI